MAQTARISAHSDYLIGELSTLTGKSKIDINGYYFEHSLAIAYASDSNLNSASESCLSGWTDNDFLWNARLISGRVLSGLPVR